MKIIVSPDKFKGSLTATEACAAISEGIRSILPDAVIIEIPMGDGGEGTAEILTKATWGSGIDCLVHDPLFRPITASYGISLDGKTAFIEMAAASGLLLLKPEERNCFLTSSFGTGELIKDAIQRGVHSIVLCIGGSATNDGGIGMANALGYGFLDKAEHELNPVGKNLLQIASIDTNSALLQLRKTRIEVACDVQNCLTGLQGASYTFGPQKGASLKEIELLDRGLSHLADLVQTTLGKDIRIIPGGGAAGGLGGGAAGFLSASLVKGIDLVMQYTRFEQQLTGVDLIITGEGKLDETSMHGKTISGICSKAGKTGIPVIVFAGVVDIPQEDMHSMGISAAYSIASPDSHMEEQMKNAYQNLRNKVCEILPQLPIY